MGWYPLVILYNTLHPRVPTSVITSYADLPSSYVPFNEHHEPEVPSKVLIYGNDPIPAERPDHTNEFHRRHPKRTGLGGFPGIATKRLTIGHIRTR